MTDRVQRTKAEYAVAARDSKRDIKREGNESFPPTMCHQSTCRISSVSKKSNQQSSAIGQQSDRHGRITLHAICILPRWDLNGQHVPGVLPGWSVLVGRGACCHHAVCPPRACGPPQAWRDARASHSVLARRVDIVVGFWVHVRGASTRRVGRGVPRRGHVTRVSAVLC